MSKTERRLHVRIVIGGVILLVAALAWFFLMSADVP
jgi:hypothetical protein